MWNSFAGGLIATEKVCEESELSPVCLRKCEYKLPKLKCTEVKRTKKTKQKSKNFGTFTKGATYT